MSSVGADRPLTTLHLDCGREWRGGQAQVLMLLRGLSRRNHRVVLLAPRGPLLSRARAEGIEAHAWRGRGDWDLPAAAQVAAWIARLRPQIVHAHDARAHALGAVAARLSGRPAVVVSRRMALAPRPGLASLKYRFGVDRFLCVSRSAMTALAGVGVSTERLAWVPSGVDLSARSDADDLRGLIGAPAGAPVVGTAAALTAEKGHEDLLSAAPRVLAQLPETRFAWMGEGPRRAELERRVSELGLDRSVHLLGFRADVRGLMSQCTVAALASVTEGFATSLLEAASSGVPAVATAVGGVPEVVIDGQSGRLVPSRDPDALAAALLEVLSDPLLRDRLSSGARARAGEFHIDRTVERTIEEYRRAMGRRL